MGGRRLPETLVVSRDCGPVGRIELVDAFAQLWDLKALTQQEPY